MTAAAAYSRAFGQSPQACHLVREERANGGRQGIPWLLFAALTAVLLFGGNASWKISVNGFDALADAMVDPVSTGSLARQVAFTALGAFSIVCLLRRPPRIINPIAALLFGGLAILAFSSVLWSDEPSLSLRRLVLLGMIALGAVWLGATRPKELPRFALFSSAVFIGIGFVAECVLGSFHPFSAEYRFAGIFHPNHQAINAAVLFFSATALARESVRYRRALLGIAGMAVLVLLLTKSRTAFVGLIAVQIILWVTRTVPAPRRSFLAVGTACVASVMIFAALYAPSSIRSSLLLGRDTEAVNLTGRYDLWNTLAPYVRERPIIGHGYGAFWNVERISDISKAQGWGVGEAHSSYIELLLSLGIPGLLLVVGVIVSVSMLVFRQARRDSVSTFTLALLGFAVINSLTESAAYASPEFQFLLFWGVAQVVVISSRAQIRSVQVTRAHPALIG